jgi:hypothetical protein
MNIVQLGSFVKHFQQPVEKLWTTPLSGFFHFSASVAAVSPVQESAFICVHLRSHLPGSSEVPNLFVNAQNVIGAGMEDLIFQDPTVFDGVTGETCRKWGRGLLQTLPSGCSNRRRRQNKKPWPCVNTTRADPING